MWDSTNRGLLIKNIANFLWYFLWYFLIALKSTTTKNYVILIYINLNKVYIYMALLYINNLTTKYIEYQDLCEQVQALGVPRARIYLLLAMHGVKGRKGRVVVDGGEGIGVDYSEVVNLAVKDNKDLVTGVRLCEHCQGLEILTDNE